VKPSALGSARFLVPRGLKRYLPTINRTVFVIEIGAASPFARKIARFRLDRDIVEGHIGFLARTVSCFEGCVPKFAFF
jgi:hypothetical protein